jgi:hypothetical protein
LQFRIAQVRGCIEDGPFVQAELGEFAQAKTLLNQRQSLPWRKR